MSFWLKSDLRNVILRISEGVKIHGTIKKCGILRCIFKSEQDYRMRAASVWRKTKTNCANEYSALRVKRNVSVFKKEMNHNMQRPEISMKTESRSSGKMNKPVINNNFGKLRSGYW